MRRIGAGWLAAGLAVAVLTVGCGEEETSNGLPSVEERSLMHTGADAMNAAEGIVEIASTGVVDAGSSDLGSGAKGGKALKAVAWAVDYQAIVDLTDVDLNAYNANYTGTVDIHAEGSVTGTDISGSITYFVEVTRRSDVVYTNPNNGNTVTAFLVDAVNGDEGVSFDLEITWLKVDDANGSITAETIAVRPSLDLVIDTGDDTIMANVEAQRHELASISLVDGALEGSYELSGYRVVTWTAGGETHTVRMDVASLNSITITIDGVAYGPYTLLELIILFAMATS